MIVQNIVSHISESNMSNFNTNDFFVVVSKSRKKYLHSLRLLEPLQEM